MNTVLVEYIESGTFVGGEEETFIAGIEVSQICVVVKKDDMATLLESVDALKTLWAFVEDLGKSNPGFLGKLCLQNYAQMNEGYMKTERVLRKLESQPETQAAS